MPPTITDRYDRHAVRYGRWWGPVLEPTALALLRRVDASLDAPPRRVLDVGTGVGALARGAVERWPSAEVVGLDGSRGMLHVAGLEARRRLPPEARDRLTWSTGLAEHLPFPDERFDLVVSSFVYQLVPDRGRALREALRVLRPGGTLGFVTWLEAEDDFAPQQAFEDLVDEAGFDDGVEVDDGRAGDVPSREACAAQLRRAGFRSVRVREAELTYAWTAASYREFLERYEAADLFDSLRPRERARLRRSTAERLATLSPTDFEWRTPVVHAMGRRPTATGA